MEMLKRYGQYVAYAAIAAVAVCLVLFGGLDAPTPGPEPSPTVDILGPSTARVGDLVVLTANNSKAKYHTWVIVPDVRFEALEGYRVLATAFPEAGRYTVILAVSDGRSVSISVHVIEVTGDGPTPPSPDPEPEPNPQPDSSWAKWTRETVLAEVPSAGRAAQSQALAGAIRGLAAKIAAGAVSTPEDARVQLRAATNQALGKDSAKWVGFSLKFSAHLEGLAASGKLDSVKQYQTIYEGVAAGLETVAQGGRRG